MKIFPDPRNTGPEGVVAVGGELSEKYLLEAYTRGIFPWPHEGYPLLWFCPDPRGVLDFSNLHVPRSLKKFSRKKSHWRFTLNQGFPEVIRACQSQVRLGQNGTWITPEICSAYEHLFLRGYVKSLEVWEGSELIGGIYGVDINGLFSGESMFFRRPNASKMAFWKMVEHLMSIGRTWMDIQMLTSVTEAMGGQYITREQFLTRLSSI